MNTTKLGIFDSLQSFLIHASVEGIQYRRRQVDFSRNHKFTFLVTVLTILQQLKGSLAVELDSVFKQLGSPPGGKSGFCKARKKLLHLFFPGLEPISSQLFLRWRMDQAEAMERVPGFGGRRIYASPSRCEKSVQAIWVPTHPCPAGSDGADALLL